MSVEKKKRTAVVDKKYCVGCGSCMKVCKREAISVPNGISAIVNTSKCVGCGLCEAICPASAIEIVVATLGAS